jgi:2,4-dienoyl-CoA reductase (NADPH2)
MRDPLFQPISINGMEIKNRIMMPAIHLNMAHRFVVTERLTRFYIERAQGGVGLITVGYATVDERSGGPGNIGAHRDEFIPGLAKLAAAIKRNGARSAVQLNHAGRYNHSLLLGGRQPVAPSAVPCRLTRETPCELNAEEIREIVTSFAGAAKRVKDAGFDAVEVLSGTGYLISEFLSPFTNQRNDDYGGSFEKRMRFGLEVARAVRKAVGAHFPLFFRINGNEFMKNGTSRAELQEYAVHLTREGADALNVNVGWHEARVPQVASEVPRGVYAYLARGIKEKVSVPVVASHRINDPAGAREMIAIGVCDMVAMGRALIADPRLPEKARMGREGDIVHCVGCGQGCLDNILKLRAVECLCNPRAGYESERTISKTEKPLKVMVVGGGAAGMSAAAAAAERGHRVALYEQSDHLGGQLLMAGAAPGREEFRSLALDLSRQLALLKVAVVLNSGVTPSLLDEVKPDAVVLATGGMPVVPSIPGAELPQVVQAWDVLAGKVPVGRRVVVVGGGAVGIETVLFLAEQGTLSGEALKFLLVHEAEPPEALYDLAVRGTRDVIVIEMLDQLGKNFGKTTRWGMLQDVERFGVKTRVAARTVEIADGSVKIEVAGRIEEIPADTVVIAVGTQSYNPLYTAVVEKGIPCTVIGDAMKPAMAFDAVHQGFLAGRGIGEAGSGERV